MLLILIAILLDLENEISTKVTPHPPHFVQAPRNSNEDANRDKTLDQQVDANDAGALDEPQPRHSKNSKAPPSNSLPLNFADQKSLARGQMGTNYRSTLATRLRQDTGIPEPIIFNIYGDSTGNDITPLSNPSSARWPSLMVTRPNGLGALFPEMSFVLIPATDVAGSPAYSLNPIVLAMGSKGPRYVELNGTTQAVRSPDSTIWDTRGNQTHIIHAYFDPANPGSGERILVSKWGSAGNRTFKWGINSSGNLFFTWSEDGKTEITYNSETSARTVWGDTAGWKWLRVSIRPKNANNFDCFMYHGSDIDSVVVNATKIGPGLTGAGNPMFYNSDNNAALVIGGAGSNSGAINSFYKGRVSCYINGTGTGSNYAVNYIWRAGYYRTNVLNSYGSKRLNFNLVGSPTLGGSPECIIFNCSIAGMSTMYHDDDARFKAATPIVPDVAIISHGHNQRSAVPSNFTTATESLANRILMTNSGAELFITIQNPASERSSNYAYQNVNELALKAWADRNGYKVINAREAFTANADWRSLIGDGTHPTLAGYQIWATAAVESLIFR